MPQNTAGYLLAICAILVTAFTSFVTWWISAQSSQFDRIEELTERVYMLEVECYGQENEQQRKKKPQ